MISRVLLFLAGLVISAADSRVSTFTLGDFVVKYEAARTNYSLGLLSIEVREEVP